MHYLRCRRVEPDNIIVSGSRENPVMGLRYTTVAVDPKGFCLNAEDGAKSFTSDSKIEEVASGICAQLIASGACPMIEWGLLR